MVTATTTGAGFSPQACPVQFCWGLHVFPVLVLKLCRLFLCFSESGGLERVFYREHL